MVTFTGQTSAQQLVRFDSNLGKFDVQLTANTPLTNANFLSYVDAGDYDNTYVHRLVTDFVIQAGGFTLDGNLVGSTNQRDPVLNEPVNNHVRGTIALAKLGNDPNSGTNQWFFNLSDNRTILDAAAINPNVTPETEQNGGFTAFGNVTADGMDIVDLLASQTPFDLSETLNPFYGFPVTDPPVGPFTQLPLLEPVVSPDNFLLFSSVSRATHALGDLDGSGDITGADVDLLYAAYGATPVDDNELDLDSSGEVGNSDRDRLVEGIADTRLGDVNFDGAVDVLGDAATLIDNLGTLTGATYAQGDLNGDGTVDVLGDAAALVENLGFNRNNTPANVSTAAVPEPTGTLFLVAASVAASLRRRR